MIQSISDIDLRFIPGEWPLPAELRRKVDDHWQAQLARNPHMWNGRVLGSIAPGYPGGVEVQDGRMTGTAVEGDFASFLAWRDWGFPEIGIRNLFGSALVLSGDGALIYGVMDRTTANAGKIYPPGGSLEPSDVRDGDVIDVIASIERELDEETGLSAGDGRFEAMLAAFDGPRISIGRVYRFDASADELVALIAGNLARQDHRELERVVAIRTVADAADPAIMPYARSIAEHLFA
jgi:8-oxo-dGTP pyrophosphatase MutT (NUDIX family)